MFNILETTIAGQKSLQARQLESVSMNQPSSLSSPSSSRKKTARESSDNTINILIHNGDFVSVDELLRSRALTILDLLVRDDCGADVWFSMLEETEELVREIYRAAFSNPAVRSIFRKCGNVFIAGQGEAAAVTASLLAMGPPPPPPPVLDDNTSPVRNALREKREAAAAAAAAAEEEAKRESGYFKFESWIVVFALLLVRFSFSSG